MSADSLLVETFVLPDSTNVGAAGGKPQTVNSSISFTFMQPSGIQTLSSNAVTPGNNVDGLIFVPDLAQTDSCYNASIPYVPANVTRLANLPANDNEGLIALAPWISPECTLSYLASARNSAANGFVFFLPNQGSTTPPSANDPAWGLGDGGAWKSQNNYPVYAINSMLGEELMQESALYSHNMTDVPFGANLTEVYDSKDYVRLSMVISTDNTSGLPSLWIFLLIILAILLAIIAGVSLVMHLIQRKRRETLRRRVAAGLVDLEALGIKRLTVPQDCLDSMPLYTYKAHSDDTIGEKGQVVHVTSTLESPAHSTGFHQPTCAICLDDFVASESQVRELPCRHIFHPECVDTFLRDNSSLCPLCKSSALPKGYCPAVITNVMVRRERNIRRIRPRVDVANNDHSTAAAQRHSQYPHMRRTLGLHSRSTATALQPGVEMTDPTQRPADLEAAIVSVDGVEVPALASPPPRASTSARREWARHRALAMLGPNRNATGEPDAEAARRPRWRKLAGGVFPALA